MAAGSWQRPSARRQLTETGVQLQQVKDARKNSQALLEVMRARITQLRQQGNQAARDAQSMRRRAKQVWSSIQPHVTAAMV